MISTSLHRGKLLAFIVRCTAWFTWRKRTTTVAKLREFAATEAGSALDMLHAAERETDDKLRRQFFRHALDEFHHADLFEAMATRLAATLPADQRTTARTFTHVHAQRQNLFVTMGRARFLAFVHLAECDGQAHFAALASFFGRRSTKVGDDDSDLAALFADVEKDERFHVSYSLQALKRGVAESSPARLRRLFLGVRLARAKTAWRRAGRQIGDLVVRALLAAIYFTVVPIFALASRRFDKESTGWVHRRPLAPETDLPSSTTSVSLDRSQSIPAFSPVSISERAA